MKIQLEPITPEPLHYEDPNYVPNHWDYPRLCADTELALACVKEWIEEWNREEDPGGWWHNRSSLIALYNEVVRLRNITDTSSVESGAEPQVTPQ